MTNTTTHMNKYENIQTKYDKLTNTKTHETNNNKCK